VTDLEGRARHSSALSRVAVRVAVVAVAAATVPLSVAVSTAGAATLQTDQAKASQLEAEIQTLGNQIGALDSQYEAALQKKANIDGQIQATEQQISASKNRISKDKGVLHKAAIEAYVTNGTSSATSALFSESQTTALDSSVYNQVISGNLNTSIDDLNTAVAQLDSERQTLHTEDSAAAAAVQAAKNAYDQAQTLETQEQAALAQVKGQIATLIAQQQAAANATAQARANAALASYSEAPSTYPAPPAAGGGGGSAAVRAAESQLGVPYVWGGESPGAGFDCSGLVAWAWGEAGISLPHYSGAQMADSAPVPISDLQPGDLLFYGPGGDTHVAMYVGGGDMIEATFPGTVVRIDPVRFTGTFAGAGRP
jgi:cell wall-associated NlpC family hydrolase